MRGVHQTEGEFQDMLIGTSRKPGLIRMLGGVVVHFRPAWTGRGYRTPIQGDGEGFPDLVILTRSHRVLYRELKSDTGRLSRAQREWLERLERCGQDVGVWRPGDVDRIARELAA